MLTPPAPTHPPTYLALLPGRLARLQQQVGVVEGKADHLQAGQCKGPEKARGQRLSRCELVKPVSCPSTRLLGLRADDAGLACCTRPTMSVLQMRLASSRDSLSFWGISITFSTFRQAPVLGAAGRMWACGVGLAGQPWRQQAGACCRECMQLAAQRQQPARPVHKRQRPPCPAPHLRQQVLALRRLLAHALWQHHCQQLRPLSTQRPPDHRCVSAGGAGSKDVVALLVGCVGWGSGGVGRGVPNAAINIVMFTSPVQAGRSSMAVCWWAAWAAAATVLPPHAITAIAAAPSAASRRPAPRSAAGA